MDFGEWIEEAVGEVTDWFIKPTEPLVLGAELWCPYGSEHSFLMLQRDEINIDNLPQANVCDCVKSVNIDDFGECYGGRLCKDKMILAGRWENPEPQTEIVNGREIITTKSVLLCRVEGMEIQAANSGQKFGKKLAEQINLKLAMDVEYPGLYDLLMDPYGSLYLNEGMYEKALAFLEDQVQEKGNIFLPTIFDGNDLKNEMVRLALGRLMPRCDVSTYDRFINGLEDTGVLTGMNEKEGWDVHYLNDEMMEMLWKDCKTTDERVKTDPVIRWQEENRVFTSSMSDAMTQLSKAVVMYLAMKPQSVKNTEEKLPERRKETGETDTVTYRRVQGGSGNNASQFRIQVNEDGTISIPNKKANLSISIDAGEHAEYFLNKRGGDAQIVEIDVPKWFDDFLKDNAISQVGYRSNKLNQGGTAPKITDIFTPGECYELPAPWIEWLEEYGGNARVIIP